MALGEGYWFEFKREILRWGPVGHADFVGVGFDVSHGRMSNLDQVSDDLEHIRAAKMLVKTQKVGAAVHVEMKIRDMQKIGNKEKQLYWENILKEVENLLYED